jgi:hypothetical protein
MPRRVVLALAGLLIVPAAPASAANPPEPAAAQPLPPSKNVDWFPTGDLFDPGLADPKEQQFYMSFVRLKTPAAHTTGWLVGFGETIGITRWRGLRRKDAWQLNLLGGLFAQFDWGAPSKDLINADYTFGSSLSYRNRGLSGRFRLLHQSSHLGDEFLLNTGTSRVNLSFESVDALLAQEWDRWRVYGGGGTLLTRDPSNLKRNKLQYGIEFAKARRLSFARPIAALDIQRLEQHKWRSSYSVRAGIEIGKPGPTGRRARLLAEYYYGYSPFGQFYDSHIEYYGGGLFFGF